MSRVQSTHQPAAAKPRSNADYSPSLILLFLAAVFTMVALTSVEGAFYRAARGEAVNWDPLIEGRLLAWLTCAAFVPLLYLLTTRLPIGRSHWLIALPAHLMGSLLATLGKYALLVPVTHLLKPGASLVWPVELRAGFLGEMMFYWAMIALCHAVFFYRVSRLPQENVLGERDDPPGPTSGPGLIAIPLSRGIQMLDAQDIDWVSAEGNYIRVHMGERQLLVRHTIRALSSKLPPEFVQVHRSIIINGERARRVEPLGQGKWKITLNSGASISSGRAYREAARKLLK